MKFQETSWSCGAAAVRNCLKIFDIRVSEKTIKKLAGTNKNYGTSEIGVITALKHYELQTTEHHSNNIHKTWGWLQKKLKTGHTVIAAVDNWEHWVLIVGISGDGKVIVFDPSNWRKNRLDSGLHILDKKSLMRRWRNNRKTWKDSKESRIYGILITK